MKNRILAFFILTFSVVLTAAAQNPEEVPMADAFRSNGKIYVVVAVLVTILAGLFFYLIATDRKLTKLEQERKQ